MKKLSYARKIEILDFYDGSWAYNPDFGTYNGTDFNVRNKAEQEYINNEFSQLENVENLIEALDDTSVFRNEMDVLEHGFATATGSNYDKMVVEFRGEKYVINDREHWVQVYDGENGFN